MIPSTVILGGIRHRVQVSDGLVVFSAADGMWGHHSRIAFSRDSGGMLWYMEFSETFNKVPVAHVIKAFNFVREWFGGDFEHKE